MDALVARDAIDGALCHGDERLGAGEEPAFPQFCRAPACALRPLRSGMLRRWHPRAPGGHGRARLPSACLSSDRA